MGDFDIEKLLKQISELEAELKAAKKYGLVWDKENTKEEVVLSCEKFIPILVQSKDKRILKSGNNNLLIEGDNYHILTSLNFVLKGSIDAIYIDPPYNTGNKDFIYNDKYIDSDDGYLHSKWLSFMQKRLILAKELLKEDGIIFISIDDIELANLKLLCDSIFSESCYVSTINVEISKTQGMKVKSAQDGQIVKNHEYVLVYCKTSNPIIDRKCLYDSAEPFDDHFNKVLVKISGEYQMYSLSDYIKEKTPHIYKIFEKASLLKNGKITSESISKAITINKEVKDYFYKTIPDMVFQEMACSINVPADIESKLDKGFIVEYDKYILTKSSGGKIRQYRSLKENLHVSDDYNPEYTRCTIRGALWKGFYSDMMNVAKEGDVEFKNGKKPKRLIEQLFKWVNRPNGLYLDFFAGSGTTGESVLDLNSKDGGNRRFILCTNNENGICETITYPRLKTAITGKKNNGSVYSNGHNANLFYFKTGFIKDEINTEQAKYNLVEKVDALLCIAENIFDEKERNEYSSHFASGNRHMFIYNDYYNAQKFDEFRKRVLAAQGEKIVYVYSSDNNVDDSLIEGADIVLKPILSKIYEIYKEIVEDIKRDE